MSTNNAVKGKLEGIAPTADNRDIQRVFEKPAKGIVASVAATVAQAETIMGFARRPCRLSAARIIGDLDVASDAAVPMDVVEGLEGLQQSVYERRRSRERG